MGGSFESGPVGDRSTEISRMNPSVAHAMLLECPIQHYEWGRRGQESLVAKLSGNVDVNKPCAELWMGAHPKAPAIAVQFSGRVPLDKLVADNPLEILGAESMRQFGPTLPLLFKVLSVGGPLSIQAHPDKSLAAQLHARDPKNYPDDNHKPEIAIPLTRLELLAGFRTLSEIRISFENYPELKSIVPPALSAELSKGAVVARSPEQLTKAIYSAILNCDREQYAGAMASLNERLRSGTGDTSNEARWFKKCFDIYGARDVGLASIFVLNLGSVDPGQAVFLGPNIPHAYLDGELIECMANSDNVVRAGLTPKYQDVPTLLDMLDYSVTGPTIINPVSMNQDGSRIRFGVPAKEFFVEMLRGSQAPHKLRAESAEMLIVLEGNAAITTKDGTLRLQTGQVALVAASAKDYEVQLDAGGVAYRAGTPL